jgi:signal transduction histidine kinase
VKENAVMLGGSVSARSNVPKGVVFEVRLPWGKTGAAPG